MAFAVGAALLLTSTSAIAAPLGSPVINAANGHTYQLLTTQTWAASEAEAVALGGHLASIADAQEQKFVFNAFGNFGGQDRLLWIGFNDIAAEGTFGWTDGSPVTFTNWDVGEPNSVGNNEDFVALYYPGFRNPGSWNDWDDRTADPIGVPFNGVVEFPVPEPTGLAALGLAAGTLLVRRRRI